MKKIILPLVLLLLIISCKREKESQVEEQPVQEEVNTEPVTEAEWTTLFDGSSLNQWRGYGSETMHPEWTITDDGAMAFTPGEEGGKNIISKGTYTNFMLSLEWKISEGGNSGIFWGVYEDEKYAEAYQTGPEIQVLDDAKHPDAFVAEGKHKAGALYDMIKAPDGLINPAGEWNKVELEVNYNTNVAKVKLNDQDAFSFPVHGDEWDAMVADSKFKGWEGFGVYRTGHIGLQDHSDKVWYRNIKIKSLD